MKKAFIALFALLVGTGVLLVSCDKEDNPDPNDPKNETVYVSKVIENKKVVIEEFTGVKCGYCPDGHVRAHDILLANPGNAFVIAYHPQSGGYNTPYAGDQDLRRTWPDQLWAMTFAGKNAMPGAFVQRRLYGGIRWQSRSNWATYADGIMAEVSPLNVGFTSSYDETTKTLTVEAQVYYTTDVTTGNTLYCVLLEDGIVTQQSGNPNPPDYVHARTFREGLSDVLGDPITEATAVGAMIKKTWTFDNSSRNYNMNNCQVVVFVRDEATNEVISGNQAKVNLSTPL
ncbi:MAG: Omp28-related outer membrane protein [Bacteroidetes bacterium]|jgi:hypothetical protein|nr:Omp28-related outer membrane protein [Bacteroidota bacterium]MBT5529621.1 Omp28-related outer membrane protein [Cytophagia bacterium]MBT3424735.1 Omp28-related outer membrane protein [Bacteroidota bacterium]MBT3801222.1 Omp28-related outer membrane protein [Bacteroidota bacterium]MBT3935993.1 Omp28-related outer membrane protein [Bacteroidota bacterium]